MYAGLYVAAASGTWQPCEDGFEREEVTFGGRHTERISVTEDWLNIAWRPEIGEFEGASFQLPDDLRLCRRVPHREIEDLREQLNPPWAGKDEK